MTLTCDLGSSCRKTYWPYMAGQYRSFASESNNFSFVWLQLLCEVEAAMINLELRTSTLNDAFIITDNLHWAKEGDLTLMLIQDWGVLKLYHTFLKDWIKVFRNATTDNTCDRNIKSLAFTPNMPKKWFNERGTRMPKMRKHRPMRKPGRNNSLRQNLRKGSQRNRLMKKQKGPTLRI